MSSRRMRRASSPSSPLMTSPCVDEDVIIDASPSPASRKSPRPKSAQGSAGRSSRRSSIRPTAGHYSEQPFEEEDPVNHPRRHHAPTPPLPSFSLRSPSNRNMTYLRHDEEIWDSPIQASPRASSPRTRSPSSKGATKSVEPYAQAEESDSLLTPAVRHRSSSKQAHYSSGRPRSRSQSRGRHVREVASSEQSSESDLDSLRGFGQTLASKLPMPKNSHAKFSSRSSRFPEEQSDENRMSPVLDKRTHVSRTMTGTDTPGSPAVPQRQFLVQPTSRPKSRSRSSTKPNSSQNSEQPQVYMASPKLPTKEPYITSPEMDIRTTITRDSHRSGVLSSQDGVLPSSTNSMEGQALRAREVAKPGYLPTMGKSSITRKQVPLDEIPEPSRHFDRSDFLLESEVKSNRLELYNEEQAGRHRIRGRETPSTPNNRVQEDEPHPVEQSRSPKPEPTPSSKQTQLDGGYKTPRMAQPSSALSQRTPRPRHDSAEPSTFRGNVERQTASNPRPMQDLIFAADSPQRPNSASRAGIKQVQEQIKNTALVGLVDGLGLGIGVQRDGEYDGLKSKKQHRNRREMVNIHRFDLADGRDEPSSGFYRSSESHSSFDYAQPETKAPPPTPSSTASEISNFSWPKYGSHKDSPRPRDANSDSSEVYPQGHRKQDGDDWQSSHPDHEENSSPILRSGLDRMNHGYVSSQAFPQQSKEGRLGAKSARNSVSPALLLALQQPSDPSRSRTVQKGNSYWSNGTQSPRSYSPINDSIQNGESLNRDEVSISTASPLSARPRTSDQALLPVPRPTIVIQPSTSVSSSDDLHRTLSSSSLSSVYSQPELEEPQVRWSDSEQKPLNILESGELLHGLKISGINQQESRQSYQIDEANHFSELFNSRDVPRSPPTPQVKERSIHVLDPSTAILNESTVVISQCKTWRSTLPPDAYHSLLEKYGSFEMHRQEVIWELCNTERLFVQSLNVVLRLFVQPLRTRHKRWIPGLPQDVMKLFDWLDDIIQLHSRISSALLEVRSKQYPVVLQVSEALRPFVSRLELHQPYLVKLESVSQLIEEMTQDSNSDFGEFIRMQSASPDCGSMSLSSFLLKPVQRLMKYPLFFKQLWDLTPRNHPDYLATFSLLHSTDIVIKVMNEVKAREDEYDLVKSLAERIKGLPENFQLARRERRLIAQGLLRRVMLTEKDQVLLDAPSSPIPPQTSSPAPTSPPNIPSHSYSPNISKLFPITSPGFLQTRYNTHALVLSPDVARPDSTASDTSQLSASSMNTYGNRSSDGTRSTTSSVAILSPSTTDNSIRPDSVASSNASFEPSEMAGSSKHPQYQDPTRHRNRSSSLRGSLRSKRESQVYAFIFTDFVLLAAPIPERSLLRSPRSGESKECWKVLEDVGMSRVLGVTDYSGRANFDHLLAVDLLPMAPGQDTDQAQVTTATPVYLSLADRSSSRAPYDPNYLLEEARDKWKHSFQRCYQYTLRSLSFPSTSYRKLADGSHLDLDISGRQSVISILASGLPLPKSPSQQLLDGKQYDDVEREREERGWWSVQFHQVMLEMERSASWSADWSGQKSKPPVHARQRLALETKRPLSITGPRPLILGSQGSPLLSAQPEEKKSLLRSFSKKGRSGNS
ncbi:hypothetical protein FRC02_011359 [Tulasnella sp. 418]|nr:hypothetical protein FRC02_011359 [Tulasnella sp. 418]